MRKIFIYIGLVILTLLILSYFILKGSITVNIISYPKNSIKRLNVIYKGGFEEVKSTRNTLSIKFEPKYTSSLVVKVIPKFGEPVTTDLDTYFEKGYKGNIDIRINENFKAVIIKENLTP